MEIIDTHSHLFTEEFEQDLPEVIARAKTAGVSRIYLPNIDCSSTARMLQVCRDYPGYCFPMIGLHPTSVGGGYRAELAELKKVLDSDPSTFVAIGEVGLDLYWDRSYRTEQEDALRTQIEWAVQYDLPLVIHCRSAFYELYAILSDYRSKNLRGIFHSFTGSREEARRMLSFKRFMLGVNGVVTFKKSELPEVLPDIPIDRLVLETDSPYLAPVPQRGKRNESAFIRFTLSRIATLYGLTLEEVARITTKNARKVFSTR